MSEERTQERTETHSCDLISRADVEQTVEDNILCYTHSDRPIDQDTDTECHEAIRTALRMLRKDLRKLPSAQPDVPDINVGDNDLISRSDAIDAVDKLSDEPIGYLEAAIDALVDLPSAQPEPTTEIQEILNYLDTTLHPIVSPDNWNVYAELHDMVSKLPSAQPEIIRCKDCLVHGICRFEQWLGLYGYCSQSERRTNEND